jgi:hypothetical protein
MGEGKKQYTVEPRRTDFPDAITPDEAITSIHEQYGYRPDVNPQRGFHAAHQFAEIRSWRYADVQTREPGIVEKVDQIPLIPDDQCLGKKPS